MIAAGAYLKALRTKTGLSQGKLAELIGVAGNTIWRIEAGKQEPGGGQLAALLTTLHGRVEDFQALIIDQKATAFEVPSVAPKGGQVFVCSTKQNCDAIYAYFDALKALAGPYLYRSPSGAVVAQLNSGLDAATADTFKAAIEKLS